MNLKITYSSSILKIILVSTFIVLMIFNYFVTQHDMEVHKNTVLSQQITNLSNTYKVSMNRFKIIADSFNSTVINRKDVLELLYKAKKSKDTSSLVQIRNDLYEIIKPHFDDLKNVGVIITLFSFENNKTFLRVHKPDKFDDDLSNVRYSFKYVNESKKIIRGLEEGKIMHAFRNIYPIFYKGEYLGSVDIAFSSSVLKKHMENLYKTESHFIINKNVFSTNIWKMKDMLNYIPSIEHENFLQDKFNSNQITEIETYLNNKLKKEIYKNIEHGKSFSLADAGQIVSFLPVENIKDKKTVAYLVSYNDSEHLKNIINDFILKNILAFLILMIIHVVIYKGLINRSMYKDAKNKEVQDYLNIAKVLIMALDNQKNVTMINEEGAKLLGYSKNEIIGKNWIENFLPKNTKSEVEKIASDIIGKKDTHSGHKNHVLTKSGEQRLLLWKNTTLYDGEGKSIGILTSGEDITEQNKINIELQKSKLEAEKANQHKSEFLANMSHEIRTPLNGILGFVSFLYKDEINPQKKEKLKIIKDSSHTLINILNDILDFSKIETGKLLIEKAPFNILETFSQTIELFAQKAKEKNIIVKLSLSEKIPSSVLGDKTRLQQVLSNLLSNSLKFSDENNEVEVVADYATDSNELFCEVRDYGIGIDASKINSIFKAFVQEDSSITRKYGGTGLGLAIIKELIEHMGGQIGVRSELGIGSTFYFTLPLIESNKDVQKIDLLTSDNERLRGKVLIVEDNKTNQKLMLLLLEDLGLECDIANDGLEAIEKVNNNSYDLILMDENMPNMNGIEATKVIRKSEQFKDIIIIAVTANALKGDKEKFLKNGMNDYLPKPIDADLLEAILKKYL